MKYEIDMNSYLILCYRLLLKTKKLTIYYIVGEDKAMKFMEVSNCGIRGAIRRRIPLFLPALALAFSSVFYHIEDAWTAEEHWECVQEAPLTRGASNHKRSIGVDTFKRGRSEGKLAIRCIDTAEEVTYRNFYGSGDWQGVYPNPNNGGTILSDGAITHVLRSSIDDGMNAEKLRWAVERGSVVSNGAFHGATSNTAMPKEYVIADCSNDDNSGKMCYRLAVEADLTEQTPAQLSQKIYWRLMDVQEKADGDRKSDLAMAPAGTQTNTEFLVDGNEDNFIRGKYMYKETGTDEDSFVNTPADSDGNKNSFVGDSVLLNPNGLVNFELAIQNIKRDSSPVRTVQSQAAETDRNNIVQVNPGSPFQSVTVKMTNSRMKVGGSGGLTNNGLTGILIDNPESGWKGPVTVDLSGESSIETWAAQTNLRHTRGIRIGMSAGNNNVATVRLKDTSGIEVINDQSSWGAERIDDRPAGRLHTAGHQSPGIVVRYERGGGSVRVSTPLEIKTNGERSPGIQAVFARGQDPLVARTRTDSWKNGMNMGTAVWSVYAAGNTDRNRLWGGTTFSNSEGLNLKQVELFFRYGRTKGGCLDNDISATSASACSAANQYVAPVPAQGDVNTLDYTTQLNEAEKTPFDSPDDGVAAGVGPMARLQHQFPDRFENRIRVADAIKALRTGQIGGSHAWNVFRQNYEFTSNYGVHVTHGDHQAGAGIVYEIDSGTKIYTSGDRSPGIAAIVAANAEAAANDIRTTVRIGGEGDFSGGGTHGETRFIIDQPITTMTTTENSGSHGIVVISTSSSQADTALFGEFYNPLYARDWTVETGEVPRNIHIDVRSNILVNAERNYGVALMTNADTTSTVTVAPGVTVGKMTDDGEGAGMLFWKGAVTVVNFGTIKGELDFHDAPSEKDRLVLRGGGTVTGANTRSDNNQDYISFGARAVDTIELWSGTIDIGVINLETMMKRGPGDATIGEVTFTADRAANTLTVSDGRLIVKGHVNLGTGTITVADAAKLVMRATGVDADPGLLAKITAASINFQGKSADDVLISFLAETTTSRTADVADARRGWLGTNTKVMASGTDITANLGDANFETLNSIVPTTALTVGMNERIDVPITYGAGVQQVNVQGTVAKGLEFGAGDDTLEINGGVVIGAVDMGDDDDTLTLRSGEIRGAVTNVESMVKDGSGTATVGDVTFTGSTLEIRDGKLFIKGHLNLGTTSADIVTVKSGGGIVIVANGASTGETYGRITAHTIKFEGAPGIEIQAENAATREADMAEARANWLARADTKLLNAAGTEIKPDNFSYRALGDAPPPRPVGGSSSDSNAYYAAGALAVLWLVLRDDSETQLVDYESGAAGATFAGVKGAGQGRSGGAQTWAKMYSDREVSAMQGVAVGVNARIGEHGYFGVSAMPSATGSADTTGLSLNRRTSFEGGRYEGRGGWQKDSLFAGVRLSYGDYRASTSFKNLFEAGGQLSGSFDLVHTHLDLGAGMQLNAGEQAIVIPSLGVYGGSLKQGGHFASNAILVADVPGYRQTYQGWRAGVQLTASNWLSWSDDIKVRPQLGLNMYRIRTSGPGALQMNQQDRLGVLNFTNSLPVRGLPHTVNALTAGISLKKQGGLSMKLDYVGYKADGKVHHGAVARMSVEF